MTRLERTLRGSALLELRCAAPELCLSRLADSGIPFWSVTPAGTFALRLTVFYRDIRKMETAAAKAQAEAVVLETHPGIWFFLGWLRRPCLLAAIALALFATLVLPDYVWTITVSGNDTIPTAEILRALDDLGVRFGVKNDSFRSQDIKNRLLNVVDGLQWAAVNCSGGLCEVLVEEREQAPALLERKQATDLVAVRDGTIVEQRVLEGEALCKVGDTVTEGQKLVSGVTDWIIDLQTAHARAEIYALTWRPVQAKTPASCLQTGEPQEVSVCRYLQLGRFRIKISGNSRICTAGCDKMIIREVLTLPGGYTFPVTLITETFVTMDSAPRTLSRQEAEAILSDYGRRTVTASMVAGQILSCDSKIQAAGGCFAVSSVYACREMIAREQEVNLFGSEQIYGRENPERGAD